MKKRYKMVITASVIIFICSTLFFLEAGPSLAFSGSWINEKELGERCIGQLTPVTEPASEEKTAAESGKESENEDEQEDKKDEKQIVAVTEDPLVIIYHTHSTESYLPYEESNYHRSEEEGTVRAVGSVLEQKLIEKGINVVHDKTIHDRPSYNESYGRSLKTVQSLMEKYPSAVYVIDLHRDAAPASASEGKYIKIDGKKVAKFSMVVGRANENYTDLYGFAKKISQKAESMYAGFGGAIIERDYEYNQYVSNRALLLEVGNNKNNIEEAELCAEYFAEVLAAVIGEEQ